jgi:hypothetical protein
MPAFAFRLDASFDEAGHIEALLRRPEVARDLAVDEKAGLAETGGAVDTAPTGSSERG